MEKLKNILIKHRDVILYLFFGALTTLVNFIVYAPLYHWCAFSASVSNIIAWIASVAFAYLTNKPFVFKSDDWSLKTVLPELGKFLGCRVGSGLFETIFLAITVDLLAWNGLIMKILVSIVVVIMNYIGSKLLVFKTSESF